MFLEATRRTQTIRGVGRDRRVAKIVLSEKVRSDGPYICSTKSQSVMTFPNYDPRLRVGSCSRSHFFSRPAHATWTIGVGGGRGVTTRSLAVDLLDPDAYGPP